MEEYKTGFYNVPWEDRIQDFFGDVPTPLPPQFLKQIKKNNIH